MGVRRVTRMLLGTLAIAGALLLAPALAQAEYEPFGNHTCKAQNGVRFCSSESTAAGGGNKVESFDGRASLDVDVTLPATGSGPFPTVVLLHPSLLSKEAFESTTEAGTSNDTFHFNNIYFAKHGYAVVTPSIRGWAGSCERASERQEEKCKEGWSRMLDMRFEARDEQYLLGLLVDEGIADPQALGASGTSLGADISTQLAYLKNRIMLEDGKLAPWLSPKGTKLEIKAALPRWGGPDVVSGITTNGRFLDTEIPSPEQSREPIGVEKQQWDTELYGVLQADAYMAPANMDPEDNTTVWLAAANKGEPYGEEAEAVVNEIYKHQSAESVPGTPAPILWMDGFTDPLLPVEEAMKSYNRIMTEKGYVALMTGSLGHSGTNSEALEHTYNEEGARFFAAMLKHEGEAPPSGSVRARTIVCPTSSPEEEFKAETWSKLHPYTITFGGSEAQTFTSASGNPYEAKYTTGEGGNECTETKSETVPNTASYTMPVSKTFTLLGFPTMTANIKTTGAWGEIASRLWDILPSGEQRMITNGMYRLTNNQTGTITFQLKAMAYKVAAGDTVKLELVGRDAPDFRASNETFSVEVSNLRASLPTATPQPPFVTNVNLNAGPEAGGASVSITGTNLSTASAVKFGSSNATSFTVNSPSSITAVAPAGTGTVDVTVSTPEGTSPTSSADHFSYLAPPTVTKLTPKHGTMAGGTAVTITGTHFTGAAAVKFGSTSASSLTVKSGTSITAISPPEAAGAVDVTVTTPGGTSAISSADHFRIRRHGHH